MLANINNTLIAIKTVAFIGAILIHVVFKISLGIAFLIFFVGWPLGGTLITLDDDFPGGWSNPDGSVRTPWLQSPFWGQIFAGVAISAIGFAIDAGWRSTMGARFWLLAVGGGFLASALMTRKWWLAIGFVVALGAFLI